MDKKTLDVNVNIPSSADNALHNLTDKPTTSIGKGFSDIFDLIFAPFGYLKEKQQIKYVEKLKKFKAELNEKIDSIPPENLQEPNLQIVGTTLEDSKFCIDSDELRNMFANLIANSMDSRFISAVHPSFSDIIKQMSPLDAQNLTLFKKQDLPIVEYHINVPSRNENVPNSYTVEKTHVFLSNPQQSDIDLQSKSISSLERLGLINITYESFFTDESHYSSFSQCEFYRSYERRNAKKLEIIKGQAIKTPLGTSFISVCLT